ncbi:MAG: VWA domain-containing protein [Deltaproteobacteria bacterium]
MTDRFNQNIETDSFDSALFSDIEATSEEFRHIIESGGNLLPDFRSFALDLFAAFYKLNVIFRPQDSVKVASMLARRLLLKILASDKYGELRDETALDGFKSAAAALSFIRDYLLWIKSDEGLSQSALMKEWEAGRAEEQADETASELETIEEAEKSAEGKISESLKKVKKKKQFARRSQESELKEIQREQKERIENLDMKLGSLVKSSMEATSDRVSGIERELADWGASIGGGSEGKSAGEKLDLAAKLLSNEKLRRLSLMVGSFKEEMLQSRRKVWAKRGAEIHDIAIGSDLARAIPSELLSLRHPALKRDFLKRLVEERIVQYHLKQDAGRGPIVVCLDGSSSMSGDKEMWSKALCLTVLEMAKRQRRKFVAIVFSSKGAPLETFGSDGTASWRMKEAEIIKLADYFPGGGTDFEEPLGKAAEFLARSKFRRGDILFITDGECDVAGEWLGNFLGEKKRLGFQVFSVLIDITGREQAATLRKFSDKIASVSSLTSKDAREIFLGLG